MKHLKKLVTLLLVTALIMCLGLPASAEEATYTLTINNTATGHTYEAYQIFAGDLSAEGVLSNVTWGSGVNGTNLLTALNGDKTSGDEGYYADAAAVAQALADKTLDADAFAKTAAQHLAAVTGTSTEETGPYTISNLSAGYYLVKDQDGSLQSENDSYTSYILEVAGDVSINPKVDVPEFQKKVKDINDSTDETSSDWQDSADHDIGDQVSFQLKATLPTNLTDYSVYKVVFTDTLSKGFTYNGNAVVKIDGIEVTERFEIEAGTYNETTGTTITLSCADIMSIPTITLTDNSVITIEYTATLNENAVLGSEGNPNVAKLEYSNNPNYTGEGSESPTGETPEDKVIVFTFQTIVNKVTKNPDYDPEGGDTQEYIPLTGAEFTLAKYDKATGEWNDLTTVKNEAGTTFTFTGLDDGLYRLTETKTPEGYNTIDPIYFTITATHDTESDTPALTGLTASQTDEDGVNLATGLVATFAPVVTDGSVSTDIVNNKGTTLPETGGMGTTLFYVIGGILMAGALVLLVTKKRMHSQW